MFVTHRKRSLLVMVLMLSQAFLFNAIFFTYGLVLTKFYAVPSCLPSPRCCSASACSTR